MPTHVRFTGSGREYFRIWATNTALTLLTLGVFSAWATVRTRRYFYGNTWLGDSAFNYTASPWAILIGRAIVVGLLIALWLAEVFSMAVYLIGVGLLFPLYPWIAIRARAFRLRNSFYRHVCWGFEGNYATAAKYYCLGPIVGVLSLGTLVPYIAMRRDLFLIANSRFGTSDCFFGSTPGEYYGIYFATFGIFVMGLAATIVLVIAAADDLGYMVGILSWLPIFVAGLYLKVRLDNLRWSRTAVGGYEFKLKLSFWKLLGIYLTNLLLIAVTLGAYIPFAKVRVVRYKLGRFSIPRRGAETFAAGPRQAVGATGRRGRRLLWTGSRHMSTVPAVFFDGRTWDRRDVLIQFAANGGIRITGDDVELALKFGDVRVSERLADIPRYLYLAGGDACELRDNSAVDAWLQQCNAHGGTRLLHRLDTSIWATMAAIATIALILASFVIWGAPALAERAVNALPIAVDQTIGEDSLALLDRVAFSPSKVAQSRQEEIRALFDEVVSNMAPPMGGQLELRSSDMFGANAFALAGNTVILTDELIELAEHDEEIIAVLAHEMGHIQNRHVMKHVARNAIVAVLWAAYVGDVSAVTGVAATMPAVLDSLRHSRAFEREADRVARDYLDSVGIDPSRLGDLLARLLAQCPECEEIPAYLSSHPPLEERVGALSPPGD